MNISEIREKYPQYNDMSDQELVDGLHSKFYSDMDKKEFEKRIGFSKTTSSDIEEDTKEEEPTVASQPQEPVPAAPTAAIPTATAPAVPVPEPQPVPEPKGPTLFERVGSFVDENFLGGALAKRESVNVEQLKADLGKKVKDGTASAAEATLLTQLTFGEANLAGQAMATDMAVKTAIDVVKSPFELAGVGLAVTAPETYNALVASPVMQEVNEAIEAITPELDTQQEIASTILGFVSAGKIGKEGVKYLINKFGRSKGKRFSLELEKALDKKKGSTLVEKVATPVGIGGGLVGYDLAIRKPDEVIIPELLEVMGIVSDIADETDLDAAGTAERVGLITARWINNNIPKEIIEASEKLQINPDDTAAQAKAKQAIDALALEGAATGIISAAVAILKYGPRGTINLLKYSGKGAKAAAKGLTKAADAATPESVKNAVGKVNTVSGKILSSTAGLPDELAEVARRRGSAIQGIEQQVKFDTLQLKRVKKKFNLSDDQIREFLANGNNQNLPDEAVEVISNLRSTIEKNQRIINKELGLTGDKRIGLQWDDGEVYLTRTYAATSDPGYAKRMTKLINRYRNTGSTSGADITEDALANMRLSRKDYQTIDNAYEFVKKTLTDEKGVAPTDAEIKKTLYSVLDNVAPNEKSVIDSIFGGRSINNIISNKVLKERQDIDESIRGLLGEVTDPLKKAELTLLNQNKLMSEIKFIRDIEKYAAENGNRNIEMGKLIPGIRGQKTGFFTDKQYVDQMARPLSEISDEALGRFGSGTQLLDNIYTSPVMIKYLQDGLNLANVNKPAGLATRLFSRASALGQATYTALDTGAYGLQLGGALLQAGGNGYLTSLATPKAIKDALYLMKEGITRNDPEASKLLAFLKEQDVIAGDPTGRSIVENAKVFASPPKTWAGKAYDKGFVRNLERLGKAYSQPDNFAKIIAFKAEQASLKSMFPRGAESVADYNRRIDLMAADRVRKNMPTYSTAAPIAKTIARTPLIGQYPLFFTEMMRTSKNMAKTAFGDLRQGLQTGNDRQIIAGLKRLTTYGGVLAAPALYSMKTKEDYAIEPKHEMYVNHTAPSWYKGGNPIFMEGFVRDETIEPQQLEQLQAQKAKELRNSGQFPKGEGESEEDYIARSLRQSQVADPRATEPYIRTRYIFSDTFDTFAAVKKPVELLIAKYMNSENVSDEDLDKTWGLIAESLGGQFVSPRFLTQGLIAAVSGVDPKTGNPIYSDAPGTTAEEKIKGTVMAIVDTLDPQTRKQAVQLLESMDSEELLGVSRGERANGFPLNSQDIIMSMVTGIKPVTDNVDKKMAYSLGTGIRDIAKIDRDFYAYVNEEVGRGVPLTNDIRQEIVEKYAESLDKKRKAYQDLSKETEMFVGMPYTRRFYKNAEDRKNKKVSIEEKEIDLPYLANAVTGSGVFNLTDDAALNIAQAFEDIDSRIFKPENPGDKIKQIGLSAGFSVPELQSLVQDLTSVFEQNVGSPLFNNEEEK
jgi:hypothetical protein